MDISARSKIKGRRPDMRIRIFAPIFFCMVLAGVVPLALTPAAAQTVPVEKAARTSTVKAAAQKWRTPWGDPDLQGSWSNATTTPLERPAKYAGREFLSKEEMAAQDKQTAIATDKRDRAGTPQDVNGAYNGFWWERGWSDGRTSLIYDPPDGRVPPMTPEGKARKAEQDRRNQNNEGELGAGPY